jgi:hypothetical protein
MSLLGVTGSPVACSGLMYAGVPSTVPVTVSLVVPWSPGDSAALTPKSATNARPDSDSINTLLGLTSRCTSSRVCAAESAAATSPMIRRASRSETRLRWLIHWLRVTPSTYCMMM